jgi:predicted ATPase
MLQRLYVNNFKCLTNFELTLMDAPSTLMIGKNGAGKSTVARVLELFQRIGRGGNQVGELVTPEDITRGNTALPIRFELEVLLKNNLCKYELVLELPVGWHQLRVKEEQLTIAGKPVYSRSSADLTIKQTKGKLSVDWHLIALPIIQAQSDADPVHIFKTWLARMIILAPIPCQMKGESKAEGKLLPDRDAANFGDWFSGLLGQYPAAYSTIDRYLQKIMPDFRSIQNVVVGKEARSMSIRFALENATLDLAFEELSDGEKCFFLCAMVLAANEHYGPLFCFWDEPDNYLAMSEVGHFIGDLRQSAGCQGQFLMTSHNGEAIRKFTDETTIILDRKSHLEPTMMQRLADLNIKGDLITALIRGDVEL